MRALTDELHFGNHQFVVEADIKGYFEHLDHDKLIEMLERRIHDGAFIRLIRKWLRAGILEEDGQVVHPVSGTPQGGVITPRTHWVTLGFRPTSGPTTLIERKSPVSLILRIRRSLAVLSFTTMRPLRVCAQ